MISNICVFPIYISVQRYFILFLYTLLVPKWVLDHSENDTGSHIYENPSVKKSGGRLIRGMTGRGK